MKVLIRASVSFLFFTAIAVCPAMAQFKIGPEVGMNFGMQTEHSKSGMSAENRNSSLKIGALAGVNIDIKVLRKCYVQTGIFYAFNNIKFKNVVDSIPSGLGDPKEEVHDDIHTFRMPLYIMYKSGYEGSGRFIAGIGPYVSYTIIANRNISTPTLIRDSSGAAVSYFNVKTNYEMELGNDPLKDQMKKWDYGLNACIGYESNVGMYFRGYFNYGLQNMLPAGTSDYSVKNWGFGLSIGFNLGKDDW